MQAARLCGWALALLGYWLPWLAPRPAALQFNGFELSDWVTRLPGAQASIFHPGHLSVLAPLAGLALIGGLLAGSRPAIATFLRRSIVAISALHVALLVPGYPTILNLRDDPQAFAQALLALVAATGLAVASFSGPRLSRNLRSWITICLDLSAAAVALWSVAALKRGLAVFLPEMATTGVGFYLLMGGCAAILLAEVADVLISRQPIEPLLHRESPTSQF